MSGEFHELDESMKEVKSLLAQLKAKYIAEERQKKIEQFWDMVMGEPLMVDDVIAKGGWHDSKS